MKLRAACSLPLPGWGWLFTIVLALQAASGQAGADLLDDIQARGRLVVGVKTDVPVFGEQDADSGAIFGLEPDLAQDLAQRLGLGLEMVPVLSAERVSAVASRRVDVLIATLNETPERRSIFTLVYPPYYESGASLLTRHYAGFTHWSDLRYRRICSRRGSSFNRPIAVTYGADIVALYRTGLALEALRDGRCDGFLGDTAVIAVLLQDPSLSQSYAMTLPPLYVTGWNLALHPDERGGRLEAILSSVVIDWHRRGIIGQLEEKWGIPRSAFSRRMEQYWSQASDPPHPQ